jgi:hypothetical protein
MPVPGAPNPDHVALTDVISPQITDQLAGMHLAGHGPNPESAHGHGHLRRGPLRRRGPASPLLGAPRRPRGAATETGEVLQRAGSHNLKEQHVNQITAITIYNKEPTNAPPAPGTCNVRTRTMTPNVSNATTTRRAPQSRWCSTSVTTLPITAAWIDGWGRAWPVELPPPAVVIDELSAATRLASE